MEGLQQGGGALGHRSIVETFHHGLLADGQGVGSVGGADQVRRAGHPDRFARFDRAVDSEDDVAIAGRAAGDGQLEPGEQADLVGEDGGQGLEVVIAGDDGAAGCSLDGHVAAIWQGGWKPPPRRRQKSLVKGAGVE